MHIHLLGTADCVALQPSDEPVQVDVAATDAEVDSIINAARVASAAESGFVLCLLLVLISSIAEITVHVII